MVQSGLSDRLLVVWRSLSETCIQWIGILWFAFLGVDVDIVNGVDANVDTDANIHVDADVAFATK